MRTPGILRLLLIGTLLLGCEEPDCDESATEPAPSTEADERVERIVDSIGRGLIEAAAFDLDGTDAQLTDLALRARGFLSDDGLVAAHVHAPDGGGYAIWAAGSAEGDETHAIGANAAIPRSATAGLTHRRVEGSVGERGGPREIVADLYYRP